MAAFSSIGFLLFENAHHKKLKGCLVTFCAHFAEPTHLEMTQLNIKFVGR